MLFLPAAALCCLCSALAAMATQLSQEDLTLTRRVGESVSFSCGGTDQCRSGWPVTWYEKKKTETFKAILNIKSDGSTEKPFNHPLEKDFTAERNKNICKLKIDTVKIDHIASYYCGCWKSVFLTVNEYLFGSGTKLDVTPKKVKPPEVTVCPVKTEPSEEGKTALMCLASDMFPPVVQISWKRQEKNSQQEQQPPAEERQVEVSGSQRSAMVRMVNDENLYNYKYICEVKHEGGNVRNQTWIQEPKDLPPSTAAAPTHPPAASNRPQLPVKPSVSFQSQCRVKLLLLLYTVLIVKSLVYCCGLSLLMSLRTKGPSTN
ncbi:immunoglobulin lambda-1 light chain-like [Cyprinodon tularosa]|uniref:immunoglobulin lambda-1 light chain-like n=1 Tax=Cyprinodon tularosa TaxID=77115 RepID=UPI0018E2898D|nr:immunoglobulin lambda-1 light chain-like [Cyprinodon tularosa]